MSKDFIYNARPINKYASEFKIQNFELYTLDAQLFFVVSQDRNVEGMSLTQLDALNIKMTREQPKCGIGQQMYGVMDDGLIIRLMWITDSSD